MSDAIVGLLSRAADTGDPRLTAAATKILGLVDDLEKQLDAYLRTEQLRREEAELAARLAEIRQQIGGTGRVNRPDTKAVRAWAARNGYEVSERGRIPVSILTAYQEASSP